MKRREFLAGAAGAAAAALLPAVGLPAVRAGRDSHVSLYRGIDSESWSHVSDAVDGVGSDDTLTIGFNSPGGSVFLAMGLANDIAEHKEDIAARNDGVVAGAALLPFMACARRVMSGNSLFHFAGSTIHGYAADAVEESVRLLERLDSQFSRFIATRCLLDERNVLEFMRQEAWLMPGAAKRWGLVDEIL